MIILDMDGVIVDFVHGLLNWLEMPDILGLDRWPKGEYNLGKVLTSWAGPGVNEKIQQALNDPDFWLGLKPTEEFHEILSILSYHPFVIASVCCNESAIIGKVRWLYRHCPGIHFAPCKGSKSVTQLMYLAAVDGGFAEECNLLIDDSDDEVNRWAGPSILVPRQWNRATGNPIDEIVSGLHNYTCVED